MRYGNLMSKFSLSKLKKAKHYAANFEAYGDAMPSLPSLALELGVPKSQITEWCKLPIHAEFVDVCDSILAQQFRVLSNKGLVNEYNSSLVKLFLTKHGYTDKVVQDNTSSDGSMSSSLDVSRLSDEAIQEFMAARVKAQEN